VAAIALPHAASTRRPAGLTLVELAISVLLLGLVLFIVAGQVKGIRRQAKRNLLYRTLTSLEQAGEAYHRVHESYPPAPADRAGTALAEDAAAAEALAPLPATVLRQHKGQWVLLDPWGEPLRYVNAQVDPVRVAANGDRPIWESAGPNRTFDKIDDYRSDELPP